MGTKRTVALLYLMNLGLLTSVQSALADDLQVRIIEKDVKKYAELHGENASDYPSRLVSLAEVYLANGMREKADKAFEQAIAAQNRFRFPELEMPQLYLTWANTLGRSDLPKAKQLLLDGMVVADKNLFGSKERLSYMCGMVSFYRLFGLKAEEQKQFNLLDEQLTALEKAKDLNERIIEAVADTLLQMSNFLCTPRPRNFRPSERMTIVGNNDRITDKTVHEQTFKEAEKYQKRAMAQFDMLPLDKRLRGHIGLKEWYEFYGQTWQAENESRTLDSISKGKNWKRLTMPTMCYGCGMG